MAIMEKRIRLAGYSLTLAALVAFSPPASAVDGYGAPDPSEEAYADFAYLVGEWQSAMVMIGANGARTPLKASARITAFYHSDGRTVQTCFNAPGFHSTDVRAYDPEARVWRALFLNARAGRWSGFTIRRDGDTVETLVPGGYSGAEDFDVRTVARAITSDSFINDVFRRKKGAEDWVQTYEMAYSRLPNMPSGPKC